MFPDAPIPPNTTSEPVDEDVEFMFPVTSTSLINADPPIPTPPATTNAPLVVDVELTVLEIPTPEPTFKLPLTPIPPTTVSAPFVEEVD